MGDVTLSQLLEEKRRLLRKVSAKLGEKVVATLFANPVPSASAWQPGTTHWGTADAVERQPTSWEVHGVDQASCSSIGDAEQCDDLSDLRTLCTSIRDSIG